ncbi:MAG: gamma-glutamylcyclotransferase [Calditerrivibrio sp.]|nr:gamma-glutamylcyclotransferase [Calditerrivibrio sp.]
MVRTKRSKVFVYGTLKKGKQFNYLMKDAKFLGRAETVEKYAMYKDNIPYVVKDEQVSTIKGEVYLVNEKILHELDKFEEHPNYYYRELIKVRLDTGKEMDAYIYFFPEKRGVLVENGEY